MTSNEQSDREISQFHRIRIWAWRLLSVATVSIIFFAVAGLLGRLGWAFELLSHFRVQYCVLLGLAGIVLACGKRGKLACFSGITAVAGVLSLLPFWISDTQQPASSKSQRQWRVVLFNVHTANTNHTRVVEFLSNTNADFVVLLEVNNSWARSLEPLKAAYPHFEITPRPGAFGIAMFSRVPIARFEQFQFAGAGGPTIVARIDRGPRPLTIVATHTLPPISPSYAAQRNQHLSDLAEYCSRQENEVIVLGDLNITSWSPFFDDLITNSGLRDSRLGHGIQPSWPARRWPSRIPIDHCLVSSGIFVRDRKIGQDLASDHLPVIVDFSLTP